MCESTLSNSIEVEKLTCTMHKSYHATKDWNLGFLITYKLIHNMCESTYNANESIELEIAEYELGESFTVTWILTIVVWSSERFKHVGIDNFTLMFVFRVIVSLTWVTIFVDRRCQKKRMQIYWNRVATKNRRIQPIVGHHIYATMGRKHITHKNSWMRQG